jgi:hypothetical protein
MLQDYFVIGHCLRPIICWTQFLFAERKLINQLEDIGKSTSIYEILNRLNGAPKLQGLQEGDDGLEIVLLFHIIYIILLKDSEYS